MPPDSADVDRADLDSADLDSADQSAPDGDEAESRAAADAPADDWEDRARRAAADLDNVRKRHVGELQRAGAAERAQVAAGWLPVIDNLERALAHADADPASIVEGVRAVATRRWPSWLGWATRVATKLACRSTRHSTRF